jgi:hypothetical protein
MSGVVSFETQQAFEAMVERLKALEAQADREHEAIWKRIYAELLLDPNLHYTYNRSTGFVTPDERDPKDAGFVIDHTALGRGGN